MYYRHIVQIQRVGGRLYSSRGEGRGVRAEDEDGVGRGVEQRPGPGQHPVAEVARGLRDQGNVVGKEGAYEVEPVRGVAGEGGRGEGPGLLDGVPDEGRLKAGRVLRGQPEAGLDGAGYGDLRHDEDAVGQLPAAR